MCKFCETLQTKKRIFAIQKEHDPEMAGFSHRYSVAIITRTFVKGRHGSQGLSTDFNCRSCGYQLNFCPECGRNLREKKDEG